MEKDTEDKISQLSLIEQNAHRFLNQKQTFQAQMMEIESALKEIKTSNNAYKIIGNIMVSSDKASLEKELETKKEMLSIRVRSIENQEKKLKEKASQIQKEVMEKLDK